MTTFTDKYQVLKQVFGYDSFRPGQEHLINAILAGQDVLGIMPTGAGKSIVYQVPALLFPGITPGDFAPHLPDEGPGGGLKSGRCPCGLFK